MESKKKMSVGMGFAAGALFGAIAVFVPLVSAGHPASPAQKTVAPQKAQPAASEKRDSVKTPYASSDATCDVQLD
jgi:hypothetical protein